MSEFPLPTEEEWEMILDALDCYQRDRAFQISATESVEAQIKAAKKAQGIQGQETPILTEAEWEKMTQNEIRLGRVKSEYRNEKEKIIMAKAKFVALKHSMKDRGLQDEIERLTK